MKKILVTGGAGYIGSFIVRELRENGFEPIIIDDFSSGHIEAIKDFKSYEINLVNDKEKLNEIFEKENFDGVIHMASFIQMGESFRDPIKYFDNNLISALNLFQAMIQNNVLKIVFSSSAGVYGTPKNLPIDENDLKNPENPYGETKLQIEKFLLWLDKAHSMKSVSIRYFNACGASLDGNLGEDHPNESHLIPILIKAAIEGRKAIIFGDNYNTSDGTCVRDYVHVLDLARAHVLALNKLLAGGESMQLNAGTGTGYSNKQIYEEIKQQFPSFEVEYGERRPGDADILYAKVDKIQKELGWKAELGLKEIIESAYKWHKNHPKGFQS